MAEKAALSIPLFQSLANELATEMTMMDIDELVTRLWRRIVPTFYQGGVNGICHGSDIQWL